MDSDTVYQDNPALYFSLTLTEPYWSPFMKMSKWLFTIASFLSLFINGVDASVKLVEFTNHSQLLFNDTFSDGTPYQLESSAQNQGILITDPVKVIETLDGKYKVILEDAKRSGYHRPHWKFHIWLESSSGFPLLNQNRVLYAVIFYDGDGEFSLVIGEDGKLQVLGGAGVADILLPWAKGTIGRGNPYHEILGVETDYNGIKYFDFNGFVGYPFNPYID